MKTETPSGNKYILTFIDNFSKNTVTYLNKEKSQVLEKFKSYVAVGFQRKPLASQKTKVEEYVRCDKDYLNKEGIEYKFIIPFTPEQNRVLE